MYIAHNGEDHGSETDAHPEEHETMNSTTQESSSTSAGNNNNTALFVGGVVLIVLAVALAVWLWRSRKK